MKKSLFAISGLAAVVLVVGAARMPLRQTGTLHVIEHATTDTVTDTGDQGDSVGDILTFANQVYDENDSAVVGSDNGYCFRTVAGTAWECNWTLSLSGGQITVEGPFLDAGDSVLAITGGTGDYMNARGEMALHARDAAGSAYDFVYSFVSP